MPIPTYILLQNTMNGDCVGESNIGGGGRGHVPLVPPPSSYTRKLSSLGTRQLTHFAAKRELASYKKIYYGTYILVTHFEGHSILPEERLLHIIGEIGQTEQ